MFLLVSNRAGQRLARCYVLFPASLRIRLGKSQLQLAPRALTLTQAVMDIHAVGLMLQVKVLGKPAVTVVSTRSLNHMFVCSRLKSIFH